MSVVLAVSGCSDDGDSGSSSASGSSTESAFTKGPEPTGSPITIGLITTETGPIAGTRGSAGEIGKAWATWVNETQGGVNGHPVTVEVADDTGAPANGSSAARKMVEEDGAVAVFLGSEVSAGAVAEYLASKDIPEISTDQGQKTPDAPASWFTTDLGMPQVAYSAADVAKAAGYSSTAGVVCSEVAACAGIGDLIDGYGPEIDVEYKGTVTIAQSATSATAQCLEIVDSGAESMSMFVGANAGKTLITTCQSQGFSGGYVQLAWSEATLSKLPGEQLGVSYSFPWWSDADPVAEYRQVIGQYAPDADYEASGAGSVWVQLQLFKKAMEQSGQSADAAVTGPDVTSAFQTVKDETLDGLLPQPVTFSATEPQTTINCFWPAKRTEDGTYSTLTGDWEAGNGVNGDIASLCTSSSS